MKGILHLSASSFITLLAALLVPTNSILLLEAESFLQNSTAGPRHSKVFSRLPSTGTCSFLRNLRRSPCTAAAPRSWANNDLGLHRTSKGSCSANMLVSPCHGKELLDASSADKRNACKMLMKEGSNDLFLPFATWSIRSTHAYSICPVKILPTARRIRRRWTAIW